MLTLLAWAAQAAILATYFCFASGRCTGRSFHIANALTAPVLILYDVSLGAWAVLPLPIVFGAMGAWGWLGPEG